MNTAPTPAPQDDPVLRESLKRCSPATYYAACKFRQTANPDDLRLLVAGVIERFVERGHRPALAAGADTLRLREDLGLDSLTMMEIVMLAEEVLPVTVANDELTALRTLGDVQAFIARKVAAARRPASRPRAARQRLGPRRRGREHPHAGGQGRRARPQRCRALNHFWGLARSPGPSVGEPTAAVRAARAGGCARFPSGARPKLRAPALGTARAIRAGPAMQTLPPKNFSTATFFSRERRRQRMLKFLETFELRSWPVVGDTGFLVPVTRADLREPTGAERTVARR